MRNCLRKTALLCLALAACCFRKAEAPVGGIALGLPQIMERIHSEYVLTEGVFIRKGDLSPYDGLFREYGGEAGFDWRLLAAIAYGESRFHHDRTSPAGATGLMGIMPQTARRLGFSPAGLARPDSSIMVGAKCLLELSRYFAGMADSVERMKFTVAAYNAGNGHVADARKLAAKYGRNPDVWDGNVAEYIRLKSDPAYYKDSVCRHGYLRGAETYEYVKEVMARYRRYTATSKPPEAASLF